MDIYTQQFKLLFTEHSPNEKVVETNFITHFITSAVYFIAILK